MEFVIQSTGEGLPIPRTNPLVEARQLPVSWLLAQNGGEGSVLRVIRPVIAR